MKFDFEKLGQTKKYILEITRIELHIKQSLSKPENQMHDEI